jgi:hypothetical protein
MLKYLYQMATEWLNIDTFVISVHSDWYFFYEALLFFRRIDDRTIDNYAFANFMPVVGEYLDLKEAYYLFAQHYAHLPESKNLFAYFCKTNLPELLWPSRRFKSIINPSMSITTLDYFFNQKTDTFKNLTIDEHWALHNIYKDLGLESILPKPEALSNIETSGTRKHIRVPSYLKGLAFNSRRQTCGITVTEVSINGLKAILDKPLLDPNEIVAAKVHLGDFEVAELKVKPSWQNSGASGFQILQSNESWKTYLEFFENKLNKLTSQAA